MTARVLVVASAVLLACGPRIVGGDGDASGSDDASADDADSAGASSDDDGNEDDISLDDPSCRAAGGHIGVVDGPHFIDGFQTASWVRAVGLVAGPDGLWISGLSGSYDEDPIGLGARVDFDGTVLDPPAALDLRIAGGRVWADEQGALVTNCHEDQPGWLFVDRVGNPVSEAMGPGEGSECYAAPAADRSPDGSALVAWVDTGSICEVDFECVMVARVDATGSLPPVGLFSAGDWGPGPEPAVAIGSESAIVVFNRFITNGGPRDELVAAIVDAAGQPTADPAVVPLNPPDGDATFLEVQALPAAAGGFHVLIGGYGVSLARVRIGADGSVLDPLEALPAVVEPPVSAMYDHGFYRLQSTPLGWMAIGVGAYRDAAAGILTLLDDDANPGSYVAFNLNHDVAIASYSGRTWALTAPNGPQIVELGCILPESGG